MTVRELIEKLRKMPQDLDVEIANEDSGSRGAHEVTQERIMLGWALPGGPTSSDVVIISSGMEGL